MFMTSKPPKVTDLPPKEIAAIMVENEAFEKAIADFIINNAILKKDVASLMKKRLPTSARLRRPMK